MPAVLRYSVTTRSPLSALEEPLVPPARDKENDCFLASRNFPQVHGGMEAPIQMPDLGKVFLLGARHSTTI